MIYRNATIDRFTTRDPPILFSNKQKQERKIINNFVYKNVQRISHGTILDAKGSNLIKIINESRFLHVDFNASNRILAVHQSARKNGERGGSVFVGVPFDYIH